MKTKIKICMKDGSLIRPQITEEGDWIDLRAAEDVVLKGLLSNRERTVNGEKKRVVDVNNKIISLGIAIELPSGFEAVVLPRSGTYSELKDGVEVPNFNIILANSEGVIDNSYCGDNDIWKFNAIALKDCKIAKNDRICQFRIQLSQKATVWQKIKWLFSSGIELEFVDSLDNKDRGGIGHSGNK